MKLWSKEALVLGGIYGVLSTPCAYLGLENIGIMLFFLFVVGVFLLFFNKMPESFSKTIKKYPQTSYYLASFGWIPYFVIIGLVGFIASISFVEYSDDSINVLMNVFMQILNFGVPLSLVTAFVWAAYKNFYPNKKQ